jgi:radical SAM protein with 4Fe4S-binding SPASM domain
VLRVIVRAGMQAGLHVRLLPEHAGALDQRYLLARAGGASRFCASHVVYVGTARRLAATQPARADRRAVVEALFALAERHLGDAGAPAVLVEGNESDGPLLLRYVATRHGAEAARVVERRLLETGGNVDGEDALAIDARGRVHPSPFWQHALLGDLRKQPLREALAHPLREELQHRAARLEGRCGGCRYLPLCRGGHRERALAAHGGLWAPDPDCLLDDDEVALESESVTKAARA